ncbi:MAG: polymerase sigma-70 factor, subfamily [Alphaproteobacteria bacterium]|jgi:RNA polymerase sigma-70 factor (ECF subfamily)|nr:polymerase sigma-70 factor, subfamily [Alphaproteobacteria bacterium]
MQTEYVLRDIAPPRLRAPVQDSSDDALIGLIAEGDKRAMQVLYARHNVRVYRFILRMTANQSLAEDLVSEVFLDVWRQAENFESKSQVSTWLLAIARYKALSALRRRHDEHLDDEMAASIEDTADNPESAVGIKDRNSIVQKCLTQLSSAHREVIDLVYYHEKSVDEVAQIVGVPPATVKTRMFYARNKMADLLRQAGVSAL